MLSVQNPGSSGGSTRHKISPITENSEPDSSSSHASQMEAATKSASLMFKMSEETSADVGNTDADNVTRGGAVVVFDLLCSRLIGHLNFIKYFFSWNGPSS